MSFMTGGTAWSLSFLSPTITTFWLADSRSLVVLLDVRQLRDKVTEQRIRRALRPGASLRRGNTSQCCWSSSLFKRFSWLVNSDLVLLWRLRVLGQIQFLDGVLNVHDVRDDLEAKISDLAVTQDPLLDILLRQIRHAEICFWSKWSLWTFCWGASRSSPAESLSGSPAGLPDGSWTFRLVGKNVVASYISGLNEPAPLPCKCLTNVLRSQVIVRILLSSCGAVGLPTAFLCGHRCTVGIDRYPPMCLDVQGGI